MTRPNQHKPPSFGALVQSFFADYLTQQRDAASDPKLRAMLDKRVIRLQGLVALRQGQNEAEAGAKVVKTADEVLGTLIDTTA